MKADDWRREVLCTERCLRNQDMNADAKASAFLFAEVVQKGGFFSFFVPKST